jgi:transcriptional regulator with XRE-family HTH domain
MGRPAKPLDPSASQAARLGAELRRRREGRGLTQEDLAAAVGFSRPHLAQVEAAKVTPSERFVAACDTALAAGGSLLALYPELLAERERLGGKRQVRRPAPPHSPPGDSAFMEPVPLAPTRRPAALSWTQRQIARRSALRVLGGHELVIAVPLRTLGAGRPVIAHEDFLASDTLARFARELGLDTTVEQISPAGDLDWNAEQLVVICGPKSSPTMAALLEQDPHYAFAPDARGRWRLVDRGTGNELVSPLDRETPSDQDLAYVARLARPDGRTFLHIAGVHAAGSMGAVHYLIQPRNLRALDRDTGRRRFSMVVASKFTRSPLAVVSAAALTAPRVHHTPPPPQISPTRSA